MNLCICIFHLTLDSSALIKVSDIKSQSQTEFLETLMSSFTEITPNSGSISAVRTRVENIKEEQEVYENVYQQGMNIDSKTFFAARNIDNLHSLGGGDILMDVCLNLSFLLRYIGYYQDAVKGNQFILPGTISEVVSMKNSYQSLLNDMSIVSRVLSLPILEPLTPGHLEKLTTIIMSCLYAAVAAVSSHTILNIASGHQMKGMQGVKDSDHEQHATLIVQKGLAMFNTLSTAIQASIRAGGQNLQNLNMLGSWCIFRGLEHILNLNASTIMDKKEREGGSSPLPKSDKPPPLKTKESGTIRPSSAKGLQGFCSLTVALANKGITLFKSLMDDLHIESLTKVSQRLNEVAEISIAPQNTASMRIKAILEGADVINFLFGLFISGYRKACSIVRSKKDQAGTTDESYSDSNSEINEDYEDEFSSSEDSSEDDDSEPLLGQWFQDNLSPNEDAKEVPPPPPLPRAPGKGEDGKASKSDSPNIMDLPDTEEPAVYLKLSTEILQFMTAYLLKSGNEFIKNYYRIYLTDTHLMNLAGVIKDLDKEMLKIDHGSAMEEFSSALSRFSHCLLASGVLSNALQDSFMTHLGVLPTTEGTCMLNIPPRTLSAMAHVLLLRIKINGDSNICVALWDAMLNTLLQKVVSTENIVDSEDVNVEYMQLLLFMFHSLSASIQKRLFLKTAECLVKASKIKSLEEKVSFALVRLVLIFEYFVHRYSKPSTALFENIQWNIFTVQSSDPAYMLYQDESGGVAMTKVYNPCKEVEDNYRKACSIGAPATDITGTSFKRTFYNLVLSTVTSQTPPKMDRKAFQIMFDSSFDYSEMYSALIKLLGAGSKCQVVQSSKDTRMTYMESSTLHYSFVVCWRLLGNLPPSVGFIKLLESQAKGKDQPMSLTEIQQSLRWIPRLATDVYKVWVKETLCEQRLPASEANVLLTTITNGCNCVEFEVKVVTNFIKEHLADIIPAIEENEIIPLERLPSFRTICIVDAILTKMYITLEDRFAKAMSDTDPHKAMAVAKDLLPLIFQLIASYVTVARTYILYQIIHHEDIKPEQAVNEAFYFYDTVLRISSGRASKLANVGSTLLINLPGPVRNVVEKWAASSITEFPSICSCKNAFAKDLVPSECLLNATQSAHLSTLSNSETAFPIASSLKHALLTMVQFARELLVWYPDEEENNQLMVQVFFPLLLDGSTEHLTESCSSSLERVLGNQDNENYAIKHYFEVLAMCHRLITKPVSLQVGLSETIQLECIGYLEDLLENTKGKKALEEFYSRDPDLIDVLLSVRHENLSFEFGTKVLKFFNKLFELAEKHPSDTSLDKLCSYLSSLSQPAYLDAVQSWLRKLIQADAAEKIQENRQLMQCFASYIVKESSPVGESVATSLLESLIPMATEQLSGQGQPSGFSELMVVMITLAGAGSGRGYIALFQASLGWLQQCKKFLDNKDVIEKMESDVPETKLSSLMEAANSVLQHIANTLGALKQTSERTSSLPFEAETSAQEVDSDWAEDLVPEDDDSGGEDSDEDSICNKLCTFTITQKEFMNQHWYHCHTCKMVDGVGVCTICAKVCHKGHDLSYAKYGSFFCDCGAKEDGSCQALVKRTPGSGLDSSMSASCMTSPFALDKNTSDLLQQRTVHTVTERVMLHSNVDSDMKAFNERIKFHQALGKQIRDIRDDIVQCLDNSSSATLVLDLLQLLRDPISKHSMKTSAIGATKRAQKALQELGCAAKTVEHTDHLMMPTLGSQEGAFENVRMNYSGDQGQTIRQLISAHMLRRVAMCCLTSPHGRRQHLAVSHEKGKITVLQLSALLRQADSSKKKLTLTRLSSAPVPFTVLSITGNPCNEDFLAVSGLKDCHVLTFTSSGSVADHLVLQPQLESGNFIIKAIWLPGSQTELAIVTADFVKIYDLSKDATNPYYYFLLPSGKVRDATFVFTEESRTMILMSSAGYLYAQPMEEISCASHGPFFVTNRLEVAHEDVKDSNGNTFGGGVSCYYSHTLQLLFFSYSQGKNFIGAISKDFSQIATPFAVALKGNGGAKSNPPALCQWSEVVNHPGLICALTQTSSIPVILMVEPGRIMVQEVKALPAKAKVQDMVAIRHTSSSDQQRTTLILLCEDGSLRIYMANIDNTSYWLSSMFQTPSAINTLKPYRKKKATKSGRPSGQVSFPVDFFENCQAMNDVEFGGNDLLQVYNVQQVKHRLNTTGTYVASTKPNGFSIQIANNNSSMVMVGVRVHVGTQFIEKAPSYLEVFGRSTQASLLRNRWYDMPFTRDESLTADKKFTLFVGASQDPNNVTMVDSIKVYGKTKESFGWPDDPPEDFPVTTGQPPPASAAATPTNDNEVLASPPLPLTPLDKLVASSIEVLDGYVSLVPMVTKETIKQTMLDLATELLILPTPNCIQQQTKMLLAALLQPNTAGYHSHKDEAQLTHVIKCLGTSQETPELDPEGYQSLVVTARTVASARPANLVQFANRQHTASWPANAESPKKMSDSAKKMMTSPMEPLKLSDLNEEENQHFLVKMVDAFWRLHSSKPTLGILAPACLPGLTNIEVTVGALVEIIHAFAANDVNNINLATKLYMKMLMSEDQSVSFACKQALIKVMRPRHRRRRVIIPSPPRCSSPNAGGTNGEDDDGDDKGPPGGGEALGEAEAIVEEPEESGFELVGQEAMALEPGEIPGVVGANHLNLEALLGGRGGLAPMLDLPPDADDEAMMELAIALSLQEQGGAAAAGLNLQGMALSGQGQSTSSLEAGTLSDTTASAAASDDEGSTAATDGSTLRTSPAEQTGSGGSESGGSAADSITGEHSVSSYSAVSGRSSTFGDTIHEGNHNQQESTGGGQGSSQQDGSELESDADATHRMHLLRIMLLDRFLQYLPELRDVGGVRAIPFMQVILMLSSDLDLEEDKDCGAMDNLLVAMLGELNMSCRDFSNIAVRTPHHEVQLIIMRLLSVFMSRSKSGTKTTSSETSTMISHTTATAMLNSSAIEYCQHILKSLLEHWKQATPDEELGTVASNLLKSHPVLPPADMSPFFLRQYVKGHAGDVFEAYTQLLTEMVLRLPYQIKKICDANPSIGHPVFDQPWIYNLCEYMITQQTPFVRRQVRKLLLFICGKKELYRQLRDLHSLESHIKDIKYICAKHGVDLTKAGAIPASIPYDTLISLIEHLKACQEVATTRTHNWQKFCLRQDNVLSSLLHASFYLDEGVAPTLLQLLTAALCGIKSSSSSSSKHKKEKKEEKEKAEDSSDEQLKPDDSMCQKLINQFNKSINNQTLAHFIRLFLLESNNTSVRWQAHKLVHHIFKSSSVQLQENLLTLMWDLWPELSTYGRKSAQFVDLLGYFSLKVPYNATKSKQYVQKATALLKAQNLVLANHPNSNIYNNLAGLVEFDGFYLESDPCLVCNNPEVSFGNIKLSAIKVDSRYTANSQIVKLVGTHTISKVSLRISDLKRTKMVRTINIYYNNRTVQSVVELKNKPTMWYKAKKCTLTAGQTELKVEFPLPIVAANVMIEYLDFYDNLQASAETLQCPRCSASVPANPGVCGNCGENVFQCHKCRAINYDEKDPFLCNACGFCKYAKFDFTLTAKACCAVDPIESEDDRKKATTTINSLLEKADRVYRQLVSHKPHLETLLVKLNEFGREKQDETSTGSSGGGSSGGANVNRTIQQIAQRYCGDCKSTFEDLSKIIQRVLTSRKELVEYDRSQREAAASLSDTSPAVTPISTPLASPRPSPSSSMKVVPLPSCKPTEASIGRCYGCAAAATEHCVTLLRALASHSDTRQILVNQGLIIELVEYNLRRGTAVFRSDVRQLLCMLTRDNAGATAQLNNILMMRVQNALQSYRSNPDVAGAVRNEMELLTNTIEHDETCWEQRLKCVMKLFLSSVKITSPVVMENITLPCLKILQHLVKPPPPSCKANKDKSVEQLSSMKPSGSDVYVNTTQWLSMSSPVDYAIWRTRVPAKMDADSSEKSARAIRGKYLMEKYTKIWKAGVKKSPEMLHLGSSTWLRRVLFSPSSRSARQAACNIVESLCQVSSRCQKMLDLLTSYLDEVGRSGESAAEFLSLYQRLIKEPHWKRYLAAKGVLPHIGGLITYEIEQLVALEDTTLSSDLSQGYSLKMLTELLSSFIEVDTIKQHYKGKLLGTVLNGYLSLRKLVVQRTKLVDETQQILLDLLEEMTTGTESETRAFMALCVETVKKYEVQDLRTPVFIFERLCNIIFPEDNDIGEFFMTLEKDPQQEDYLQGRMQGNPYSSNDTDLAPLMRDVKNKICRDCELVALLEDDTGMELLVSNKIISLDLPVKEVYKKIWCHDNEGEPMRIVYRMRGLLGDATEEFIETLDSSKDEEADDEEIYKMANVMHECEGLEVILSRLASLTDLVRGRQLLTVMLKLFDYCIKVKANRQRLIQTRLQSINIMLAVLNRVLFSEQRNSGSGGGAVIAEQVLAIMEIILQEANSEPPQESKEILTCDKAQLVALLDRVNSSFVRSNANVLQGLMRIIPFLSFGDNDKMATLINYFKPYLNFEKFDEEQAQDHAIHLQSFCVIAAGIENNANGNNLKELIIEQGIVKSATDYIIHKMPEASNPDSAAWKEFLARPALPYVLRLLAGLSTGHSKTQELVGADCIPGMHRMEQMSSEEGIGTLSENLMEALKKNPNVAKKIEEVRTQTKAEKKRLAMAMRMKQLGALGMSTNERGQVTAKSMLTKQMEELVEETGLTCCICREGYKYQPNKVLVIYTFTKRIPVEEFENKPRKTQGYSTVSHFNIIHYDCHMSAVRLARAREEWESAALQNANTKCNGLLPLWGPNVPESAFANCLARHNTYLQECTGHREPTQHGTLHDLKLLMLRFAHEKSFSDDSGGGGRQSNVHLVPYMIHMALYVINTTRSGTRESKNLSTFLKQGKEKWVESSYEVDGPHYYTLLAAMLLSQEEWKTERLTCLRRLIITGQARLVSPGGCKTITDKAVKDYTVYKSYIVYWALMNCFYTVLFKKVSITSGDNWSSSVADYIRNNDETILKGADKLLATYESDLLPCESFAEFCDVNGLLDDIPKPDTFIQETLKSL
ncbi:E3 ubiquitin-protein ligase UBR4-like isoform X1 [Antedon mediterranea]|uniref:E3 ubiquitin-protein ligase UBR4-like isoform X1 n=1 Tax=Antedon mediterranea TaxID=105859 RepID=UPI003AF51659